MDTITYSAARASLAATMEKVCQDREPLIITRSGSRGRIALTQEHRTEVAPTEWVLQRKPPPLRNAELSTAAGGRRLRRTDRPTLWATRVKRSDQPQIAHR